MDKWWLQGNAKVAPVEVTHDRGDLPTSGFAAPVRDGQAAPRSLDDSDTMGRLDALLSSITSGMDGWDGDGVFAPEGAAGKKKKGGGTGSSGLGGSSGGGSAGDHADWSRDGAGYFGGTADDYDSGLPPGSHAAAGGAAMSHELEEQVQALKAALEAAKKKLARSREAEGKLQEKYEEKERQLQGLQDEKVAAERERRQAQKAAAEAARQAAAKKRAAKRSRLLSSALPEGDEDAEAMLAYDLGDDADLPPLQRALRQCNRAYARRKLQLRRWWDSVWPLVQNGLSPV